MALKQQVKVSTGLFIPQELLTKVNMGREVEEVEIEFGDKEIRIHPIEKKGRKRVTKGAVKTWQSVKGHWRNHPVFGNMQTKEIIEWIRGSDSDV